ncbi:MAG: alpha/beta hydrolase fold domain-containing protein, partial [bacterium]|nr:alpha/beta hydrolase fold domain-containing protein [bacterium]
SELQVNKDKVVLYGDSAGGCLAASVSLMARDRKEFSIAFQMLIYPVVDYLQESNSLIKYKDATWSANANKQMWKLYLGDAVPNPIDYASPLYAKSLANLPPAYVVPQEMDSLCDEGIAYANRLEASNVPTVLNVVKGSYHAFESEYPSSFVINILKQRCIVISEFFKKQN